MNNISRPSIDNSQPGFEESQIESSPERRLLFAILKQYICDLKISTLRMKKAKTAKSLQLAQYDHEKYLNELNLSRLPEICEQLSFSFPRFCESIRKLFPVHEVAA